jgi:hypothetical protein
VAYRHLSILYVFNDQSFSSIQFRGAEITSRIVILGTVTGLGNEFPILLIITDFCLASKKNLGEMDMK